MFLFFFRLYYIIEGGGKNKTKNELYEIAGTNKPTSNPYTINK